MPAVAGCCLFFAGKKKEQGVAFGAPGALSSAFRDIFLLFHDIDEGFLGQTSYHENYHEARQAGFVIAQKLLNFCSKKCRPPGDKTVLCASTSGDGCPCLKIAKKGPLQHGSALSFSLSSRHRPRPSPGVSSCFTLLCTVWISSGTRCWMMPCRYSTAFSSRLTLPVSCRFSLSRRSSRHFMLLV